MSHFRSALIGMFLLAPTMVSGMVSDADWESPEALERRLRKAEDEYRERVKYDHVIVNDDLEEAVQQVRMVAGLDGVS